MRDLSLYVLVAVLFAVTVSHTVCQFLTMARADNDSIIWPVNSELWDKGTRTRDVCY